MTYDQEHQLYCLIIIGVFFVAWVLRNTPLGFLWKILRMFLIILFATLFVNYVKKELKDWWGK
jgi:energy-coupling factor transporter transmembrane protein EcfT